MIVGRNPLPLLHETYQSCVVLGLLLLLLLTVLCSLQGTRSGGGARAGRRMDHYHMRRRYLHAGLAGAAGGGMVLGLDDDLFEEDPFVGDEGLLDDMDMADIMGGQYYQHTLSLHKYIPKHCTAFMVIFGLAVTYKFPNSCSD